jgi:Tfp pilus assembly protein PilE
VTRPSAANRASQGLTLIELMTSVTIALALSVLATVCFLQVRAVLQRMRVRLEMHNSARFLYQTFAEQMAALQQDGAMWVETTQDGGSGTGTVSITFLKGKTDEHGFTTNNGNLNTGGEEFSVYQNRCCDLDWCSWRWDQSHAAIYLGTTSPPHQFPITTSWPGPNGDYNFGIGNVYFMNMPQPLEQAVPYPKALPPTSSQAALNGNRYGSPDYQNDVSDYQDLQNQMAPVIRNVTKCVIELILSDGSVIDADTSQSQTQALDGNFVDGHCSVAADGNFPFKRRPRLIRLLFDMTDPRTGISQSFSFSFQPPGMLPSSYPSGKTIP